MAPGLPSSHALIPPSKARELLSVANLTRKEGIDFLRVAAQIGIKVTTKQYPLIRANEALADLRGGRFEGAAVLMP